MKITRYISLAACCAWLTACAAGIGDSTDRNIARGALTLDSLYKHYCVPGTSLLRENFPFAEDYMASYPAGEQDGRRAKEFAYLWPFLGTFSAANAMYEATGADRYLELIEEKVLPGLEEYFDPEREPHAYSSYVVNTAPESGRFYDDNTWAGIEYLNLYRTSGKAQYLARAEEIWRFLESGTDEKLGGGIYWCEQNKISKNTCSNAPAAVFALKLFQATGNARYLAEGKRLYHWTEQTLRDPSDCLYLDHITVDGNIDSLKYSYNSGQMIQAAALLYGITGEPAYLEAARRTAASATERFTVGQTLPDGRTFRMLRNAGNTWFSAVMLRGFCELYGVDPDGEYLDEFLTNLDWAWENCRDDNGLFISDWERGDGVERWLLNQAAMVEMFARLGQVRSTNINK